MTDHVGFKAARAPRKQDETAQHDGRRRARRPLLIDRDLAELEALLTDDLQRSSSPSIAADAGDSEQSEPSSRDAGPARRPAPALLRAATLRPDGPRPARPAPRHSKHWFDEFPEEWKQASEAEFASAHEHHDAPALVPGHPCDLDEDARRHGPARKPRLARQRHRRDGRVPLAAAPRVDDRSFVARAMRAGAIAFSFVALIGASALLALLVVGGEQAAPPAAENAAQAGQLAAVAERATVPAPSTQTNDAPVVTGSTAVSQDTSRTLDQDGTVGQAGGSGDGLGTQQAYRLAPQPAASNAADAGATASTAEAAFAAPAPAETASAERANTTIDDRSVAPVRDRPAEAAAATRSASVTTHVNMRASADNAAAVVAVVPGGKNVGVVACREWCEVVYGEQQGFIHRRFVTGEKK